MGCNEMRHFKCPRSAFDPLTGKYVLENQEKFATNAKPKICSILRRFSTILF